MWLVVAVLGNINHTYFSGYTVVIVVLMYIFLATKWCWVCFHVLLGHLYIFFCTISVPISSSTWDMQIVAYSHNEKVLSNNNGKKITTDSCNNLDDSLILCWVNTARHGRIRLQWYCSHGTLETIKKASRLVVMMGCVRDCRTAWENFVEWWECFVSWSGDYIDMYICQNFWTVHLKWVLDTVGKLYSNTVDF